MIATRSSWKSLPFKDGKLIPYSATWSEDQFSRISAGLIPKVMEDKWFVFFEEPHLFFHRSWTGHPIYRITIAKTADGYQVREAQSAWHLEGGREPESAFQVELLDFIVSNLLLGERKDFPLPPYAQTAAPHGLFQHAISGTAYPEKPSASSKHWWHFWK